METTKRPLTLQEAIIIGALILGVAIFGVQYSKQKSIERQQQIEIESKQKIEEKELAEARRKNLLLNACMDAADSKYWEYMKLNGTERNDGTVWAANSVWDRAEKTKRAEEEMCIKKYK